MNTRRTILGAAALHLFALGLSAQLTAGGSQPGRTSAGANLIPGLEVVVKGQNGTFRYAVRADGRFTLGSLANGQYRVTFAFRNASAAKAYADSHPNNTRTVIVQDGANTSTILWDCEANQMLAVGNNASLVKLSELAIDITDAEDVSGQILKGFRTK